MIDHWNAESDRAWTDAVSLKCQPGCIWNETDGALDRSVVYDSEQQARTVSAACMGKCIEVGELLLRAYQDMRYNVTGLSSEEFDDDYENEGGFQSSVSFKVAALAFTVASVAGYLIYVNRNEPQRQNDQPAEPV
jgi:hypothetical protein